MIQANYLDEIVRRKQHEVTNCLKSLEENDKHPLHAILRQNRSPAGIFSSALKREQLAVIAEIKRKSPSRGMLCSILDPESLAKKYFLGGAAAISVLTDYPSFGGSLEDLQRISQYMHSLARTVPVLRKDFIVHPIQLAEAVYAGASSVLLIAGVLKENLGFFIKEATRLGLETLTEVHDLEDLHIALDAGAPIIGVNHRNLKSFAIDLTLSEKLRPHIPAGLITVAESGIHTQEDAAKMRSLGYDAILVGEALVSSHDPAELILQMTRAI